MCEYTYNVCVCSVLTPYVFTLFNRLSGGGSLLWESGPAQGFFPLTELHIFRTEFLNLRKVPPSFSSGVVVPAVAKQMYADVQLH